MNDETQAFPAPGAPIPFRVPEPPKPSTGRRNLTLALVAAGALVVGCCGGFGIATVGQPEAATVTVSSPSPYRVTEYVTASPSPAPPAAAASPTKAAAPTIEDGVWIVGVDFPAGTYRTTEAVSDCYWGIYKAETNQSDIIDNDIVDGGRPTVVLRKGHEFKSSRCGTWTRIK